MQNPAHTHISIVRAGTLAVIVLDSLLWGDCIFLAVTTEPLSLVPESRPFHNMSSFQCLLDRIVDSSGKMSCRTSAVSGLKMVSVTVLICCYLPHRRVVILLFSLLSQLLPLRLGVRRQFLGQRHGVSWTPRPLPGAPRIPSPHPHHDHTGELDGAGRPQPPRLG